MPALSSDGLHAAAGQPVGVAGTAHRPARYRGRGADLWARCVRGGATHRVLPQHGAAAYAGGARPQFRRRAGAGERGGSQRSAASALPVRTADRGTGTAASGEPVPGHAGAVQPVELPRARTARPCAGQPRAAGPGCQGGAGADGSGACRGLGAEVCLPHQSLQAADHRVPDAAVAVCAAAGERRARAPCRDTGPVCRRAGVRAELALSAVRQ